MPPDEHERRRPYVGVGRAEYDPNGRFAIVHLAAVVDVIVEDHRHPEQGNNHEER